MTSLPPAAQYALFLALAGAVIIPAILVVSLRNIVHAAFWLVPCLLGVAGIFVVLGSAFLAAVQILIYVGAIMVLLLFALMLTSGIGVPIGLVSRNRQSGWALLVASGLALAIVWTMETHPFAQTVEAIPARSAEAIGRSLLTTHILPFEVASVLLLAAMIAAVVLARREDEE
jgi:NADH:ubiquinone oxidoreductase subunit 6 (subunit J)